MPRKTLINLLRNYRKRSHMHRGLVHMHGRCNFNLKCCASPPWRFGFCCLSIFYSKKSVLLFVSANGSSYFYFEDSLSIMWQTAAQ